MTGENEFLMKRLKGLRVQLGKSQEEFALELGISRSCLANYEVGKRRPDNECLCRIIQIYHLDENFFHYAPPTKQSFCREESPKKEADNRYKTISHCIEDRGNKLNLSALNPEQKISMLSYYDYLSGKYESKKSL